MDRAIGQFGDDQPKSKQSY